MNATKMFRVVAAVAGILIPHLALCQTYTILTTIPGTNIAGVNPVNYVTVVGTNLFGMTEYGGTYNKGIVFKINFDGTGYTVVHTFNSGTVDGYGPVGGLTAQGTKLYGMTQYGGDYGYGTIFVMNTDGSAYNIRHSFSTGNATNLNGGLTGGGGGCYPTGSLTISGSRMYGMAPHGGFGLTLNNGGGVLFTMSTDGSGFAILHSYSSYHPTGSLLLISNVLYGVDGNFEVFQMNADGSGYTILNTGAGNGSISYDGSAFYGMSLNSVFKMQMDGSGYTVLHSFTGQTNDGAAPQAEVVVAGAQLYGMTRDGGSYGKGVLFMMNVDGGGYTNLHSFADKPDGSLPFGSPSVVGTTVYGISEQYGSPTNCGIVFRCALPVKLAINGSSGSTTLSWPTNAVGYVLQTCDSISSPNWTAVPTSPTVVNELNIITNLATRQPAFFRLVQ